MLNMYVFTSRSDLIAKHQERAKQRQAAAAAALAASGSSDKNSTTSKSQELAKSLARLDEETSQATSEKTVQRQVCSINHWSKQSST